MYRLGMWLVVVVVTAVLAWLMITRSGDSASSKVDLLLEARQVTQQKARPEDVRWVVGSFKDEFPKKIMSA